MKRIINIVTLILITSVVSGCFQKNDINKSLFVTSIGLDYDEINQEYIVYYHVTNPFTLTIVDVSGSSEENPYAIAIGKGKTIQAAFIDIIMSTPQFIDLSHVQSYVLSYSFFKYYNLIILFDLIKTNTNLFPTAHLYITNSEICDVFQVTNTEKLSPLYTILTNAKRSIVYNHVKFKDFAFDITSQYRTISFPIITATKDIWKYNDDEKISLTFTGNCFMSRSGDKVCLSHDDYYGLYWLDQLNNFRTHLTYFSLYVRNYKLKVKHLNDNKFVVKIRFKTKISENYHQLTTEEIKYIITTTISQSINTLFNDTKARNIDIFSLDDILYRKNIKNDSSILESAVLYYDIKLKVL